MKLDFRFRSQRSTALAEYGGAIWHLSARSEHANAHAKKMAAQKRTAILQ